MHSKVVPYNSEPLWWEKIGKVVNQAKLAIPSHSEPFWWEKIEKVANWAKLAILSHSEPLQWENIGKVVNRVKLAIPSHSEPLWLCTVLLYLAGTMVEVSGCRRVFFLVLTLGNVCESVP